MEIYLFPWKDDKELGYTSTYYYILVTGNETFSVFSTIKYSNGERKRSSAIGV